jgi:hypothetical protein
VRFLIKEIEPTFTTGPPKYNWQYLAFFSLWISSLSAIQGVISTHNAQDTKVLLCFDLSNELKRSILRRFRQTEVNSVGIGPFALYDILLEPVIAWYNDALWGFRGPIRKIEKVCHPIFLRDLLSSTSLNLSRNDI